jgi:hypothetical protein
MQLRGPAEGSPPDNGWNNVYTSPCSGVGGVSNGVGDFDTIDAIRQN